MCTHNITQLDLLILLLQLIPFLKSLNPHDFNVLFSVGTLGVSVSGILVRACMTWLSNKFASQEASSSRMGSKLESSIESNNANISKLESKLESSIESINGKLETNNAKIESKIDQLAVEVRNDHRRVTDRFVFLNSVITVGSLLTSWRLLGGS